MSSSYCSRAQKIISVPTSMRQLPTIRYQPEFALWCDSQKGNIWSWCLKSSVTSQPRFIWHCNTRSRQCNWIQQIYNKAGIDWQGTRGTRARPWGAIPNPESNSSKDPRICLAFLSLVLPNRVNLRRAPDRCYRGGLLGRNVWQYVREGPVKWFVLLGDYHFTLFVHNAYQSFLIRLLSTLTLPVVVESR